MKLTIREIHGAYVGKHCAVVGPLGERVFPPVEKSRVWRGGSDLPVRLGTGRDACEGFLAGYEFARKERR